MIKNRKRGASVTNMCSQSQDCGPLLSGSESVQQCISPITVSGPHSDCLNSLEPIFKIFLNYLTLTFFRRLVAVQLSFHAFDSLVIAE